MAELPDEVFEALGETWNTLGLNPVYIYRLCERGYLHCEIEHAMKKIVGDDWKEINASTWIDRMEADGIPSIMYSLLYDSPPLIDILDEEISLVLTEDYPEELCAECKHIKLHERVLDEVSQ
jgi:hypothetical protein